MRVYNGTNSQVDLPLTGNQRITIASHSVSKDIMPSTEFLSLLVSSYDYNELALIVSGPFEINMCSGVSGCVGFVCQSLEEAINRFQPEVKEEKPKEKKEEVTTPNSTTAQEDKSAEITAAKDIIPGVTTEINQPEIKEEKVEENTVENIGEEDVAAKIKKLKKLRAAKKNEVSNEEEGGSEAIENEGKAE